MTKPEAWSMFFVAALERGYRKQDGASFGDVDFAAVVADRMLEKWVTRFGATEPNSNATKEP